jgi:hypothetical protein
MYTARTQLPDLGNIMFCVQSYALSAASRLSGFEIEYTGAINANQLKDAKPL